MESIDSLETILEILFRHYPAQSVLERCEGKPGISQQDYVRHAYYRTDGSEKNNYSQDDLANQWSYYQNRTKQEAEWNRRCTPTDDRLNPMDALFFYAERMLTVLDNEVVCRYERLLNWQKLTQSFSTDLLVAAFWAMKKRPEEMRERDYAWKLILGHDNYQLNRILERGLAENHFHLYGSAPYFQLAWLSLMNRPMNGKLTKNLYSYHKNRIEPEVHPDASVKHIPLYIQCFQAAAIRFILFSEVSGFPLYLNDERNGDEVSAIRDEDKLIAMICEPISDSENALPRLQLVIDDIQDRINVFRETFLRQDVVLPDYALVCVPNHHHEQNRIQQGERWLLYQCLRRIWEGRFPDRLTNLFYAYLLLKETLRQELVYTDDRPGFSHFQDYDWRKFHFVDNQLFHGEDGEVMAGAAVHRLGLSDNIRLLEIRVSPCDSARENAQYIRKLDRWLNAQKDRIFYTVHFIKQEDERKKDFVQGQYRHHKLRHRLRRQAWALITLRERYPEDAERLRGIDAASKELSCRPEVFGVAFRYLHEHTYEIDSGNVFHPLPQLRRTYHVGEDFLDVTDGLRAIDEAIRFLELESGDRLGHAIALGIDVREWYTEKTNHIALPKQDYLDNVVWLYHKLIEYQIKDSSALQEYLKQEFSVFFQELYLKNMPEHLIREYLEAWRSRKSGHGSTQWNYTSLRIHDIHQYYLAWMLRGDDPELYFNGYFWPPETDSLEDRSRVCRSQFIPENNIREIPEVFLLYYFYQYSSEVWHDGVQIIEKEVPKMYIEGVEKVQREMQRQVGKLGLGIETNPTSNVRIGTFHRYDKHPILRFYNQYLEVDSRLLEENPQLLVSINTDDQGIFHTSLDNEFSLMACALEEARNPEGGYKYPKQRVYAWLDSVRQMGITQSFADSIRNSWQLEETERRSGISKEQLEYICEALRKTRKDFDQSLDE